MRVERQLMLINPKGFHVRPAGRVAETALRFAADIHVAIGGKRVNAKSALSLLVIAAPMGDAVALTAEGEDARQAADAIEELFLAGFGEMDGDDSGTGGSPRQ